MLPMDEGGDRSSTEQRPRCAVGGDFVTAIVACRSSAPT